MAFPPLLLDRSRCWRSERWNGSILTTPLTGPRHHSYAVLGYDAAADKVELFNTWGTTFTARGEEGFEKVVDQVAGFEKKLGIHDLDQFTPTKK